MNRQDTNDIKWWLGGIFFAILFTWFMMLMATTIINDNQHRQICLDHPTYKHCTDDTWF